MTTIYPVIMCGGYGTRLWPMSTKKMPKQFHPITSDLSMIQETISRFASTSKIKFSPPNFICSIEHKELVLKSCSDIGVEPGIIILEPTSRNTGPVASIASLEIAKNDPSGLILLVPADHHIKNNEVFHDSILKGIECSRNGYLTVFGIKPTKPTTSYGYIEKSSPISPSIYEVKSFHEKPPLRLAKEFIEDKNMMWNSGMFLSSPSVMQNSFKKYAKELFRAAEITLKSSKYDNNILYLDPVNFTKCENISIDKSIMEKSKDIALICSNKMGWCDIGSWDSILEYNMESQESNSDLKDSYLVDCTNTFIKSDGPKIAAVGLTDIIVIAMNGKILVSKTGQTEKIRLIDKQFNKNNTNN